MAINKHIDNMDIEAEIEKNVEKYREKLKKQGIDAAKLQAAAKTNTKNIASKTAYQNNAVKRSEKSEEEKAEEIKRSTEYYNQNAKPGSLAAKANMVKQYNEKKEALMGEDHIWNTWSLKGKPKMMPLRRHADIFLYQVTSLIMK